MFAVNGHKCRDMSGLIDNFGNVFVFQSLFYSFRCNVVTQLTCCWTVWPFLCSPAFMSHMWQPAR